MSALNSDEESIRSSSSSLFLYFYLIIYFHATDTTIQPKFSIYKAYVSKII